MQPLTPALREGNGIQSPDSRSVHELVFLDGCCWLCVCFNKVLAGCRSGRFIGPMVAWRDPTPLAYSFPLHHYARVRYSGILIPMPLHFAITITRYSPGLRVAPDLCCLAIYISSKCFSIPTEEGLTATQMDTWTFTFHTIPVFLLPLMPFHSSRGA